MTANNVKAWEVQSEQVKALQRSEKPLFGKYISCSN